MKQNADKQSVRCRVQNTGYRHAPETQGLSSIKNIQSERKDLPIEIKNNLQGNNSRADEAQINDLEHKEAKKQPINPQQVEKESKKCPKQNKDSVSSLWDNFKFPTFASEGVPEGEEREQKLKICSQNNERILS